MLHEVLTRLHEHTEVCLSHPHDRTFMRFDQVHLHGWTFVRILTLVVGLCPLGFCPGQGLGGFVTPRIFVTSLADGILPVTTICVINKRI